MLKFLRHPGHEPGSRFFLSTAAKAAGPRLKAGGRGDRSIGANQLGATQRQPSAGATCVRIASMTWAL